MLGFKIAEIDIKTLIAAYLLIELVVAPAASHGRGLPSSPRSREAVVRQKISLGRMLSAKNLAWGAPVYVRIFKTEERLEVWLKSGRRYRLFKCYPI